MNAKTVLTEVYRAPWDTSYVNAEPSCNGTIGGTDIRNRCPVPVKIYNVAGSNVPNPDNRVGIVGLGGTASDRREFVGIDAATGNRMTPTTKANFATQSFGPFARNDIDDYDGYQDNVAAVGIAGNTSGDFVINSTVGVVVDYLQEPNINAAQYLGAQNLAFNLSRTVAANPTNIKMIQVTATDNATAQNVVLWSYSHNIGTAVLNYRMFQ